MKPVLLLALAIGALPENNVFLANHTGIPIARIKIDDKWLEGNGGANVSDELFIPVTPEKHHLTVVFRGGADIEWPHFDFKGVHEIIFERIHHEIRARVE